MSDHDLRLYLLDLLGPIPVVAPKDSGLECDELRSWIGSSKTLADLSVSSAVKYSVELSIIPGTWGEQAAFESLSLGIVYLLLRYGEDEYDCAEYMLDWRGMEFEHDLSYNVLMAEIMGLLARTSPYEEVRDLLTTLSDRYRLRYLRQAGSRVLSIVTGS